MNVKLSILFILAYQVCVGQIHITESLKDQICFDTFGERIDEVTIDENGNELSSVLFPDNMISIWSCFSATRWAIDNQFTTLKYDLLEIEAISRRSELWIVIGEKMIFFEWAYDYKTAIKRMLRILRKYKVDESLEPLYCGYLTQVFIQNKYNRPPENNIVKEYQPYLFRLGGIH